jgi:predicted transposase/invertase (TIGR01784 family)
MTNENDWKKQFSPEILKAAEKAVKSGRQIALTDDIVFKMFFAGNTPESKKCLCSFLSAVIGKQVKNVEVTNSEILPDVTDDKSSRLDINCVFDNGDKADIEMQCSNQQDDQRNRALYYGGKLVATSLKKGELYSEMRKSYQITVTNYIEFDDDDFFTEFNMYSVKKEIVLSDCETIYFIELPKLKKFLKCDFENITPLQFWAIMIKYYQNTEIREKLLETSKYKEDSAMAEKVASLITDDMRAWAIRLSREGGEMDRLARLKIARREGEKRGIVIGEKRGRKQGIAEGSHSAKLETARNFLRMGFPAEKVAEGTGLSVEEIQNLK